MNRYTGLLSDKEALISNKFQDTGYILFEAEDKISLDRIRNEIAAMAPLFLDIETADVVNVEPISQSEYLNTFHSLVTPDHLNDLRIKLIDKINAETWVRSSFFNLARTTLDILVGNELAMQKRINLSIQLPSDHSSLLPLHSDVWSGDSPFEVVVWVPLVDCQKTKSMFILPPEPTQWLHDNFHLFSNKSADDLFNAIKSDLQWIEIKYGSVLLFNQNLPHGNQVNEEQETRWSMNCRFKSIFSPYGDKKLGEFFEPITLRAASRLGMNYEFPRIVE